MKVEVVFIDYCSVLVTQKVVSSNPKLSQRAIVGPLSKTPNPSTGFLRITMSSRPSLLLEKDDSQAARKMDYLPITLNVRQHFIHAFYFWR